MIPVKLPPGVVRTGTDGFARGRWWNTNLVRWQSNNLMPVGGWERITRGPLPSTPRRIMSWRDLSDIRRTLLLCDHHIIVREGGQFLDVTPDNYAEGNVSWEGRGFGMGLYSAGTFGTPRVGGDARLFLRPNTYSLDTFGEDALSVDSGDGRLLLLSPRAAREARAVDPAALPPKAVPVPNAPITNRAVVVTEERHVMLFGAGGNPRRVAWCDREDYTNWDFADLTNSAGFFDIDTPGWIVAATKVRGGVLIWTDSEVWVARYRGQPDIYGFERVGRACGMIGPQAFATAAGVAFWMGEENFWMFDGALARPLPSDVSDFVYGEMDRVAGRVRAHGSGNGSFPEVWFWYPSRGQRECDRYVVFSYDERWWSLGAMQRTAACESGVFPYPLAGTPDAHVMQHEIGWTDAGRSREVWAESAAFSVGGGERTMHVLGAQMDSGHGYDATRFSAFARDTRDGAEWAEGPFAPRDDGWTDCRFSGRDIRLRIENTRDAPWSIGEMRFDARPGGRR